MLKISLKILPLAILLGACSFVPTYEQPEVNLSERWMQMAIEEQAGGKTAQSLGWHEFFQDAQLQALIAEALKNNHDLRTAALNVQLAQEQYHIQKTDKLPSLALSTSSTRTRTGHTSATGVEYYGNTYSAGLGMTRFELDFFGRVRALSESALNNYLQTQEARDAVQLGVINGVANAYYAARISKSLMDISEQVLQSRQESAKLAQMQFEVGLITAVVLNGYENAIETARADYYGFQRQYQQATNALSVLVGVPVEKLQLPASSDLSVQFANLSIPAGIPSTILQKRPDVRQAEYKLKAANADIGAARAALFPTISLTGNAGYTSTELNQLLQGPSSVWSITPSITLPIFNRGKLNSAVRISEISQQMAVENYQATVQTAFKEVADTLVARQTYDKQYQATERAVHAQNEVLRLEKMRFEAGVADGLTLIDAERNSFAAKQGLLSVQLSLLQNMVALYTAMGGGLEEYGVSAPVAGEEITLPPLDTSALKNMSVVE